MASQDDTTKLQGYYDDFFQDVLEEAASNNMLNAEAFFELCTADLIDAGVIPAAEQMQYIRPTGGVRVDGYCGDPLLYNETGEARGCVLSLIVLDFSQDLDIKTLTKADMDADFKRVENYLRYSLDPTFREKLEVTSPGYDLAEMIASRWESVYKVRLFLLTNKLLSGRVQGKEPTDFAGREVVYDVWDIRGFYQINAAAGEREPLVVDFTEYEQGAVRALLASDKSSEEPVYLTAIPGEELARIYDRWGARLLEQNVRVFLQARSKVNRGIKSTLDNDPAHFFSFNNGITGTAEGIHTTDGKDGLRIVSLDNFQIVNGGQTTASVHAAYKRGADLSKVFVQAKITVIEPEKARELVPRISEYANSQNRVSSADFFANHPYHVRMENFSRTISAPQKAGMLQTSKWFYERARGSYRDQQAYLTPAKKKKFGLEYPRSQTFTKTDLAKYLMVWSDKAYIVNRGAQKNFTEFAVIIEKAWETSQDQFGERYFKEAVAKKIIFNATERIVQSRDWYEAGGYRAQHVALTIGLIWNATHGMKMHVNFQKVWNDQEVGPLLEAAIGLASDHVHEVLMNPGAGYRNISEWAKQERCWNAVKKCQPGWDPRWLKELLTDDEVREEVEAAKKDQHVLSGIEYQTAVVNAGSGFWLDVSNWLRTRRDLVSEKELGILRTAVRIDSGSIPSDKQSAVLVQMMQRLEKDGCPYRLDNKHDHTNRRRRRRRKI